MYLGQAYREPSRSITGAAVAIEPVEWDRHRLLVAIVHSEGGELNLRMVADGFAPVFPKYCLDHRYFDAQASARASGAGIWSALGAQQAPWEWRKSHVSADDQLDDMSYLTYH